MKEKKHPGLLAGPWVIINNQCATVMKQKISFLNILGNECTSGGLETMTDIGGISGIFCLYSLRQPSSEKYNSQRNKRNSERPKAWS